MSPSNTIAPVGAGEACKSDYTISADAAEGQWVSETFLLKNDKTLAKKFCSLFCHRKRWQRERLASNTVLRSITNSHVQESPGA
jgi:hypothetical protein